MDSVIEFLVPAIPIAQPRPRAANIGGRIVMRSAASSHPSNAFKATARIAASGVYSGPPLTGSIVLTVVFVLPRPKNRIWKSRPMPRENHTKRPDLDNLMKSLKDALSGTIWKDDSQVFMYRDCCKVIAAGDEQPHAEVRIEQSETH